VVQKSHMLDQMNQQLIASYFPSDASFKNCTPEIEGKRYFYNEITYHESKLLVSWGYQHTITNMKLNSSRKEHEVEHACVCCLPVSS
jgi:hypothetical protein